MKCLTSLISFLIFLFKHILPVLLHVSFPFLYLFIDGFLICADYKIQNMFCSKCVSVFCFLFDCHTVNILLLRNNVQDVIPVYLTVIFFDKYSSYCGWRLESVGQLWRMLCNLWCWIPVPQSHLYKSCSGKRWKAMRGIGDPKQKV